MKKIIFNIFLILIFKSFSIAQSNSNSFEYASNQEIFTLYEKGKKVYPNDTNLARTYFKKGLELSHYHNFVRGIIDGQLIMAKYSDNEYVKIDKCIELLSSQHLLSNNDSVRIYSILGSTTANLGAFKLAIEYIKKVLKIRKININEDLYYPIENIGFYYSQLSVFDSANLYYNKAEKIASEIGKPNMLIHCYNNMSSNFENQNLIDEALHSYYKSHQYFNKIENPILQDSLIYGISLGNTGRLFIIKNDFEKAQEYLMKSVIFINKKNKKHYYRNLISLAETNIYLREIEIAEKIKQSINIDFLDKENLLHYYEMLSNLYRKTNDKNKLSAVLQKHILLLKNLENSKVDSKINELLQFRMSKVKNEWKLEHSLRNREQDINRLRFQLIALGMSLFLLIIIILFIKYKSDKKKESTLLETKNKLHDETLKNKEIEQQLLQKELNYKNKDLTDFAIDITRKQEFIEELTTKLSTFYSDSKNNEVIKIKEILNFVKDQKYIDKNHKIFQENIDKVNHEFIDSLKIKFPNLTLNELQICALLRLQLSTKEIATIKGINADSVKTLRYRLRKKLNLETNTDIRDFLARI